MTHNEFLKHNVHTHGKAAVHSTAFTLLALPSKQYLIIETA